MDLEIIITEDGSHSLLNRQLNEVYHSRKGAMAESEHVFIRAGFEPVHRTFGRTELLEVGFGTGLNALLTALRARETRSNARYMALETDPLPDHLLRKLNYGDLLAGDAAELWRSLHACGWGSWQHLDDHFDLLKVNAALEHHTLPEGTFNLVYFDAFAPQVQPGLWQPDVFGKLFHAMQNGGILVTYSARGEVRRTLQKTGFTVERLPGPMGKREMLRATKIING